MYIRQCKYAYVNLNLEGDEAAEMQATALYSGLKGDAIEFAITLSQEVRHDFAKMAAVLRERFPYRGRIPDPEETIMSIMQLDQGKKTFRNTSSKGQTFSTRLEAATRPC